MADADFGNYVELEPELKRVKLRRSNWDSDTYEFDEVLTQTASQKRVYEVAAKPVVESVLDDYNGTVMAYGQTGTGETFTLGQLGEGDTSNRGIMVRSIEDILACLSPDTDSVIVSYLQHYMETLQDLLSSTNDNIPIVEDPRTGDVSMPGATLVEIRDQQTFLEVLRIGEANRFVANRKLNTESSRSHAILTVHIKRSVAESEDIVSSQNDDASHLIKPSRPLVRKSKLVVVDLAGSERVHKSGSEGHVLEEAKSINLSLSSLGKCINALGENNAHVPFRDSKLTRMLRDSFGGTARTSLIVTIGPSPHHRGETCSTILFGQRAMKVENILKIKEFDYKSWSRELEVRLDKLIMENERLQCRMVEVERNFAEALEKERLKCQLEYMELVKEERLKCQTEYMELVKELEQKLGLNQERPDCNADHGENPCLTDTKADRISCLPAHVIDQILLNLSIKEAVRTSVLSNNWRYKWATMPDLVFEVEPVSTASDYPYVIPRIIDEVLLLHFGPIKMFRLCCLSHIGAEHIDRWTFHITRRSIKVFVLEIWEGPRYKIPQVLFSCQSLQHLGLKNCWLKPPATFEGLRNLKFLELDGVTMAQDAFEKLISSCPLLENMVLEDLDGITEFNIHAPNLKHFELVGIFDDISFEKTFQLTEVEILLNSKSDSNESTLYGSFSNLLKFFAHLSCLKELRILGDLLKYLAAGVVSVNLPLLSCINLSVLYLEIDFNDVKEISAALCVFRSSPNLRKLEIFARTSKQTVTSNCTEDVFSDWPAMPVRHVGIYDISGIKSEFDFIRFVLLYSPVLQRMTLQPVLNVGSDLAKELSEFKRASGEAEIIYLDPDSA